MITRSFIAVATVGLAAVLALAAAPASADPDPAARTQAAAHFRQGQAYFQHEDYDRAIAEYQAAFDLSAEPSLIFNIALCYDRSNRPEQALQAFQHYLQLAPEGSVGDEARNDVARLVPVVEKIAAERKTHEAEAHREAARRHAAALREAAAHNKAVAHRVQVARAVMLAGAAIGVTGAAFHTLAWQTRDHLTKEPSPDAYLADRHTFELRRGIAIGGYAVGGAALATGLVLALLAGDRKEVPQLSAAITPGGAAVVMGWSR
ncbi:MAG TPA: tetratricopeptide repeat protein [Kofleriaceae bacterium]